MDAWRQLETITVTLNEVAAALDNVSKPHIFVITVYPIFPSESKFKKIEPREKELV